MRRGAEAGGLWGGGREWVAVGALLAGQARTEMGRERALTVEPLADLPAIQSAIEATRQGRLALAEAGPPPLDTFPDVRPILGRCRITRSVLDGTELALLVPALDAGPRLVAYGRGIRSLAPAIATLAEALPRVADLSEALRSALAEDGSVTDDASPRLRHLRRQIRERRRRIVADLERAFQGSDADRLFADRYVTMRHGRDGLPVRAEARTRGRGIVHAPPHSGPAPVR